MSISRREMLLAGGGIAFATQAVLNAEESAPKMETEKKTGHLVLLGDSIFDNESYVGDEDAVIDQVRKALGPKWKATLLAVDGNVVHDVKRQLRRLPESTTHIVLSVGGNDALGDFDILQSPAESSMEVFGKLAKIQARFAKEYSEMLDLVLKANKPTAVCSIYNPNFGVDAKLKPMQEAATSALAVFNDGITRAAFKRGVPLLDLRLLFTSKEDYANPIEPGPKGGAKIAKEIAEFANATAEKKSVIYCG